MERVLDWIFTGLFIIAMVAIIYFVFKGVSSVINGPDNPDTEISMLDDEEEYYDVDAKYDNEDEDFYEDDGEDLYADEESQTPSGYSDDAIADIMKEITGDLDVVKEDGVSSESVGKEEPVEKKIEESVEIKPVKPSPPSPKPESQAVPTKPETDITVYNAKYLVLAGSFSSKSNAESHSKKLEKMGYQPEVVNFINSQMHTVVAARYNSRTSAEAAQKQLKSKKVDCYIHTKK